MAFSWHKNEFHLHDTDYKVFRVYCQLEINISTRKILFSNFVRVLSIAITLESCRGQLFCFKVYVCEVA